MSYNLSFTRTYEGLLRVAVAIDLSYEALAKTVPLEPYNTSLSSNPRTTRPRCTNRL